MKVKFKNLFLLMMTVSIVFGSSVFAFSDIKGDPAEKEITALKEYGIINGINDSTFAPNQELSYAGAVALLVKAFDLNLAHFMFIKEPEASDYFTHIENDRWYSTAFVKGHLNNLSIPKDVQPKTIITREQFAHLLFEAIKQKGDYAFIEIWININDQKEVDSEYMDSIQKLLIANIAELNKENNFNPNQAMTRSDAAKMLYNGLEFIKNETNDGEKEVNEELSLNVSSLTNEVNKVTVSWGMKTWGHEVTIKRIEFKTNGEAHIYYELQYPLPDGVYPAAMVEPEAITYISSEYKPVLFDPNQEVTNSVE